MAEAPRRSFETCGAGRARLSGRNALRRGNVSTPFSRTVREVPFLPSLDERARIARERVPTACKAAWVPFRVRHRTPREHGLNLRVNDARIDAAKTKRVAQYVP